MSKSKINIKKVDDNAQSEDALLKKLKEMEIPKSIKSLTGIIKVENPNDFDYDAELYAYFQEKYGL